MSQAILGFTCFHQSQYNKIEVEEALSSADRWGQARPGVGEADVPSFSSKQHNSQNAGSPGPRALAFQVEARPIALGSEDASILE